MEFSKDIFHQCYRWLETRLEPISTSSSTIADNHFLPNFCSGNTVASVMLIAQMLAFVIALVTRRISFSPMEDLIMISLFVQWIALTSVAVLCGLRQHFNKLAPKYALIAVYFLLLCITFVIGELALWLLAAFGKLSVPHGEWYAYFHIQNLSVSAIVNALALRYFFAKHELKQRTLSEARAKTQALQSRIRPHFLYSSMNIIASLTRTDPAKAEAAIEDVADLFRMMLSDSENLVPIKNEVAVAQKYLTLESLRLDNRLRVHWDVAKFPRTAVIPVLILQPLLEHTITCCVEPSTTGNTIQVKLWEQNEIINIRVSSIVCSTSSSRFQKERDATLQDVRMRLENHYGRTARLDVTTDNGEYLIVVAIPARGDNT